MTGPPVRWDDYAAEGASALVARWSALTLRGTLARGIAELQARGEYDSARHADSAENPPLTLDEHLQVLAVGECVARTVRHLSHVHHAFQAGATWRQIAAAVGSTPTLAWNSYVNWLEDQHRGGVLSDEEYRRAYEAANRPLADDDEGAGS